MSFTDEEIRMKAVEISFGATSAIVNARIINDYVFDLDYYQFVDGIATYIKTGNKPIKNKIHYK